MSTNGRCPRTGKVCFYTEDRAIRALNNCRRRRRVFRETWRTERGIYLCKHCDCWHLTSTPQ